MYKNTESRIWCLTAITWLYEHTQRWLATITTSHPLTKYRQQIHPNIQKSLPCRTCGDRLIFSTPFLVLTGITNSNQTESTAEIKNKYRFSSQSAIEGPFWLQQTTTSANWVIIKIRKKTGATGLMVTAQIKCVAHRTHTKTLQMLDSLCFKRLQNAFATQLVFPNKGNIPTLSSSETITKTAIELTDVLKIWPQNHLSQ